MPVQSDTLRRFMSNTEINHSDNSTVLQRQRSRSKSVQYTALDSFARRFASKQTSALAKTSTSAKNVDTTNKAD